MDRSEHRLLYLEDEGIVARNTMRELRELGYGEIAHFRRWSSAEAALEDASFDAAIVDVHLEGSLLDGIDVGGVVNARYGLPIVVTTSFSDERTLTRLAALPYAQYVHKPFTPTQLDASLRRVLSAAPPVPPVVGAGTAGSFLERYRYETRFVRANGRRLDRLDFARIRYLEADGAYTVVHCEGDVRHLVDRGLRATVAMFGRDDLFQTHKSYAVPHHAIRSLHRDAVELSDGHRVPLGRTFRTGVLEAVDGEA